MIYLIQAEGVGHIKIGFTDGAPEVRLAMLQTGSPVLLRLLGTLPGDEVVEKDLHRRFAAARVHGEWFKPVEELLALVPAVETLRCEGVEVVERSVQIRILTVGRKQFTAALFKQLVQEHIIDWDGIGAEEGDDANDIDRWTAEQFVRGIPWGRVRQGVDPDSKGYYLLWQNGSELRSCFISIGVPKELLEMFFPHAVRGYGVERYLDKDKLKPDEEKLRIKLGCFWMRCRTLWDRLDQLFIGV